MTSGKRLANIRSLAGQLFIVGFDGTEFTSEVASLLKFLQPAGIILFARNIVNPGQTHKLLKDCRKRAEVPLFTCVDMEGGLVDRFRDVLGATPSAAEVFATADRALFRKQGKIIGQSCRALGFNLDFAPVLDLASSASLPVMGSRVVSNDPEQVVLFAREFLVGLSESGVMGVAKHFPGLGAASLDTHQELPIVKKDFKKLWGEDLYPYRAMRRELPMVMVSHANYASATKDDLPASLSFRWMSEVLRRKMDYRGLIVSDDLEMGGVLKATSIDDVAVQFIRAGGDICLICHTEENVMRGYERVVEEAECNRKFQRRVEASVKRVVQFKKTTHGMLRASPSPRAPTIQRLSRQLWEFGEQVRFQAIRSDIDVDQESE